MTQQMLPLLRFDGYHVLADLAGVPDLYHRIRPTLVGLLPHKWNTPANRALTPWARSAITLWVLVTIPMMALMLLAAIGAVPRILGSTGSVVHENATAVGRAWEAGSGLDVASNSVQLMEVALPALACLLVLSRFGNRFFRGLLRWSRGSARKSLMAALVSALVVTTLSWAWWPHPGTYRPFQPGERGLFASFLPGETGPAGSAPSAAAPVEAARVAPGVAAEQRLSGNEPLVAPFRKGAQLPTKNNPALALVLVPAGSEGAAGPSSTPSPGDPSAGDTWVFPFDKPLPPDDGDNQSLAVNTTDSSVVYDVAFALVWAQGNDVLNVNEAHAYASCTDCVAVAVAFQVVLIMDNAQVVVPQNLAVAANYDCLRCITAAIASQLVLSVEHEPGEEDLRALGEVWDRLLTFAADITSLSLTEITNQLESFKSEIVAILMDAPPLGTSMSDSTTATGSGEDVSGPSPAEAPPPSADTETAPTAPAPTPSQDASESSPAPDTPSAPPSPTQTDTASPSDSSTVAPDSTSPSQSASP
jgi:putative peptide zinc metalloprotease protein